MNIQKETILVAIITFLVGGIGGYALGGKADYEYRFKNDRAGYGAGMMWDDEYRLGDEMGRGGFGMMSHEGAGHMMDMMVSSEREFIEGMIPHHEEAVATAKEVIARGATTPGVRALVEGIVTAQESEIADMKAWYQSWYGEAYVDKGNYRTMMRELEGLSGAALDEAFLEDMIVHHMGAIMMARSVSSYIEHDELRHLTANIIKSQSAEIVKMRQLLEGF